MLCVQNILRHFKCGSHVMESNEQEGHCMHNEKILQQKGCNENLGALQKEVSTKRSQHNKKYSTKTLERWLGPSDLRNKILLNKKI